MALEESVTHLADLRSILAELEAEAKDRKEALAATIEGKLLVQTEDQVKRMRGMVAETEDLLRQSAITWYGFHPEDKHPHPAVTIKLFHPLVYEPALARDWCIQWLPDALNLNARAFEKEAMARPQLPDFVQIVTEVKATIATDLATCIGEGK